MGELPTRKRSLKLKEGSKLPEIQRFKPSEEHRQKTAAEQKSGPAPKVEPAVEQPKAAVPNPPIKQADESRKAATVAQIEDEAPIRVRVRLGFSDENQKRAVACVEKVGGDLAQLTTAVIRAMTISDRDFEEAGAPQPRMRLSNYSVQVPCSVEAGMYTKWAKKLDPFSVMKQGDIVRGAANVAFNRAAQSVLKELM